MLLNVIKVKTCACNQDIQVVSHLVYLTHFVNCSNCIDINKVKYIVIYKPNSYNNS